MTATTPTNRELDLDQAAAILTAEHELTQAIETATALRQARDELVAAAVRASDPRTVARSTGLHPLAIRGAIRRQAAGETPGYEQPPLWAD